MAVGPVQLVVLGFEQPQFHGEIIAELERLRESDTVRVIDALAVHKDADGGIEDRTGAKKLERVESNEHAGRRGRGERFGPRGESVDGEPLMRDV